MRSAAQHLLTFCGIVAALGCDATSANDSPMTGAIVKNPGVLSKDSPAAAGMGGAEDIQTQVGQPTGQTPSAGDPATTPTTTTGQGTASTPAEDGPAAMDTPADLPSESAEAPPTETVTTPIETPPEPTDPQATDEEEEEDEVDEVDEVDEEEVDEEEAEV